MNDLDRDVEAQAFHHLHRAACAKLLVAVLSYGLTLLLLYGALGVHNGWMSSAFLVASGFLCLTYRARYFWQITWSGRVILVLCAAAFAQGAMYLASPVFWFLPIGLSLTLPIANADGHGLVVHPLLLHCIHNALGQHLGLRRRQPACDRKLLPTQTATQTPH